MNAYSSPVFFSYLRLNFTTFNMLNVWYASPMAIIILLFFRKANNVKKERETGERESAREGEVEKERERDRVVEGRDSDMSIPPGSGSPTDRPRRLQLVRTRRGHGAMAIGGGARSTGGGALMCRTPT